MTKATAQPDSLEIIAGKLYAAYWAAMQSKTHYAWSEASVKIRNAWRQAAQVLIKEIAE